jgi:hypothetical protein
MTVHGRQGRFRQAAESATAVVAVAAALGSASVLAGGPAQAAFHGLPTACSQAGAMVTCSYPASASGQEQVLPLPAGLTSVQVTAIGAAGGTSAFNGPNGSGGEAAQVTGTVAVVPGSTLYVEVGGTPTSAGRCVNGGPCVGGWNGGGDGGSNANGNTGAGGGGGSDVRTISRSQGGTTLDSRLIVAGGGGGSGQGGLCGNPSTQIAGSAGGDAGLTDTGGDGGSATLCSDMTGVTVSPASGGTQGGGGDGGQTNVSGGDNRSGSPGASGQGAGSPLGSSGGGGGGYWGGGSGADIAANHAGTEFASAGGGGGGGSSLVPAGYGRADHRACQCDRQLLAAQGARRRPGHADRRAARRVHRITVHRDGYRGQQGTGSRALDHHGHQRAPAARPGRGAPAGPGSPFRGRQAPVDNSGSGARRPHHLCGQVAGQCSRGQASEAASRGHVSQP